MDENIISGMNYLRLKRTKVNQIHSRKLAALIDDHYQHQQAQEQVHKEQAPKKGEKPALPRERTRHDQGRQQHSREVPNITTGETYLGCRKFAVRRGLLPVPNVYRGVQMRVRRWFEQHDPL